MAHQSDGISYHSIISCSLVVVIMRERFSFPYLVIMKPSLSVVKWAVKKKMSSSHRESSSKKIKNA